MIGPDALRRRAIPVDRSSDRVVALVSMAIAVGYLVAAVLAAFLPEAVRREAWLPLHLALAGGATTAIAGIVPFFTAAIAAAPPTDPRLRFGAVAAVGLGALGVTVGVVSGTPGLAVGSALAFIAGIGLVGVATVRPLRHALGPARGIVTRGYIAALSQVAVGALLATLLLAGWPPVAERWGHLKAAHAWLNIVGFVSLVIVTTLLHFFPTVVGARIAAHRSARVAVAGLGVGAPTVAAAMAIAPELPGPADAVARVGALLAIAGAAGLTVYAWRIWRTRAHWTTDPGWHAFAMGGLASSIAWFDVGMAVAGGRILATGADPAAWSSAAVAGPLAAGWAGLAVVASATHLLPAVGPGDSAVKAHRRRLLGRAGLARLVVIDVGIAGLSVGMATGASTVAWAGLATLALGFGASAALFVAAVAAGLGSGSAARTG